LPTFFIISTCSKDVVLYIPDRRSREYKAVSRPTQQDEPESLRVRQVEEHANAFIGEYWDDLGLSDLEDFAAKIEARVAALDQTMLQNLKGETALSEHAEHMALIEDEIFLLQKKYLPELRKDQHNDAVRIRAIGTAGFLEGECKFMRLAAPVLRH
jgi:hypothetical protein